MPRCASFEPYPGAEEIWSHLQGRFGMDPEGFRGYRLWHYLGRPTIWIAAESLLPDDMDDLETMGLPLLRQPLPRGLPTTAFLQRFGHLAKKNVIRVDPDAVPSLMRGESLPWEQNVAKAGPFILASHLGILGRGWIKQGRLLLDAPKEWAKSLDW
ncbi:MAG: hypothetical protein K9K39_04395 [Desulfohalobiaceae bacterium]|nr:hypothetical protein [Desulfohalobiaceae bacterium]